MTGRIPPDAPLEHGRRHSPLRVTYELCIAGNERSVLDHLMNAIVAAGDQDRTTWLTDAIGHRLAKIAPVDERTDTPAALNIRQVIPDNALPVTRELLMQVLMDAALIVPGTGKGEAVWEALENLILRRHPGGKSLGNPDDRA